MMYERPVIFWLVIVFVFCALLWLLSEVLLPFVAGVALAYVQVPLADRLERLGMNRTVAALLIVVTVVLALLAIIPAVVLLRAERAERRASTLVSAQPAAAEPDSPRASAA